MKFIKGLLIGSLLGFGIGSALSERQRAAITDRVRRQTRPIKQSVAEGTERVADAATGRVTGTIDDVAGTAAAVVADESGAVQPTSTQP